MAISDNEVPHIRLRADGRRFRVQAAAMSHPITSEPSPLLFGMLICATQAHCDVSFGRSACGGQSEAPAGHY